MSPLALRDLAVSEAITADPLRADRRRGFLLLRSMVGAYLRRYRYPDSWTLIGVERVTTSGRRTDLLFRDEVSGTVTADEIKTAASGVGFVTAAEGLQVATYIRDLRADFGPAFSGVRLVHLGQPAHATFFATEADVMATVVR